MPSLIDNLLMTGAAVHLPALDGQDILVLSGPDDGKSFTGVIGTEEDFQLTTELSDDPRAKRVVRFYGDCPAIARMEKISFVNERGVLVKFNATRKPGSAYLSTDFELQEISGKDQ